MVDVGGENRSNFKPKPLENANKVSIGPRPSLSEKAKLTIAAFVASLGIGGGAAATHPGQTADLIGGSVDKAIHVGLDDSQQQATDKVRKELAVKGIHFGDPREESAIATDPNTGKDGLVWRHGTLGDTPISGTIGVKMEMQSLIVRDEASTDGKVISQEEIKKMGVNLEDLWMVEVHGGPITDEPKEGDWVMFMGKDKDGNPKKLFAKEEFAKLDTKNVLNIETHKPLDENV